MTTKEKFLRKMNQCYEMAGMARQDGDTVDAERQMRAARKWKQLAEREG